MANWSDIVPRVGLGLRSVRRRQDGAQGVDQQVRHRRRACRAPTATRRTRSTGWPTSSRRSWIDQNANFVPDCDLTNPLAQDLRSARRRPLRRRLGHELRQARHQPQLRPRGAERLGDAAVPVGVLGERAAADHARRLGRCRLLPPLVRQLRRHRQPQPDGRRLQQVQRHRAARSRGCPTAAATPSAGSTTSTRTR